MRIADAKYDYSGFVCLLTATAVVLYILLTAGQLNFNRSLFNTQGLTLVIDE